MRSSKNLFLITALAMSVGLIGCPAVDDEHEHECEEDAYQCDGDILQQCSHDAGWEDVEDCAESMQMCHAEGGHCMDMEDSAEGDDDMGDM